MTHQVVITATEGHRSFGKLLKRVFGSDEHLIVERDGYPVAVLLSYQEYELLRRTQAIESFEQFSHAFGREIERQNLSEEDLINDLKQARQEIFREQYGDLSP
ncbi:MAG: type II toxin-antitoxin system Phd/YefM family antitoxin [Chloroflexi bacterium]|nr:type II toxin-antitoxin system Phd/YefM family antitoxin [Chloroflexota bacterium]